MIYGVTSAGGAFSGGNLFRIGLDGSGFRVLHDFDSSSDGATPLSGLVFDGGFLYGVASAGGTHVGGTLFKQSISPEVFTVVHHFSDATDGSAPVGRLYPDSGALYGLASQGGTSGSGTLFVYNPAGSGFQVLHHFNATSEGCSPKGNLVKSGSDLYGVSTDCGPMSGGTIFKLNASNTLSVLRSFNPGSEISYPEGGLTLYSGKLYGFVNQSNGAVFTLTLSNGNIEYIHSFDSSSGAQASGAPLIQNSLIYGACRKGGYNDDGVFFSIGI
jgi:uncharacterized repeat protein (TIGR03803 family)